MQSSGKAVKFGGQAWIEQVVQCHHSLNWSVSRHHYILRMHVYTKEEGKTL